MNAIVLLISLAGAPPAVDLAGICGSAEMAALPEDRAAAYQGCVRDEQSALDQLRAKWTHFSAAAQDACVASGGIPMSYVELLTCLEMQPGGSLSLQGGGAASAPLGRPPKEKP